MIVDPWRLHKTVLPQHTDHAGVMWHGAYLLWLEEARIEALEAIGLTYRELSKQGFEMPVVSLEINYLRAIHHGEEILLETRSFERDGARWPWQTNFLGKDHSLLAVAWVYLVLISQSDKGTRVLRHVPDFISSALLDLQRGPSKDRSIQKGLKS